MVDKHRERFYLDQLQAALGVDWDDRVTPSETPDFLIETPSEIIGIELTVFHHPPTFGNRPHQEQQALQNQIVERAHEKHKKRGGPALYVTVFFREHHDLRKSDIEWLADVIADAVHATPPPPSIKDPVTADWQLLPKEVAVISIDGSIDGIDALWDADSSGWVAQAESDLLQNEIDRKTSTVDSAKAKCDSLWLVIVIDSFSLAAPSEFTKTALSGTYKTRFDEVFVFDPHPPRAYKLKCPSNIAGGSPRSEAEETET